MHLDFQCLASQSAAVEAARLRQACPVRASAAHKPSRANIGCAASTMYDRPFMTDMQDQMWLHRHATEPSIAGRFLGVVSVHIRSAWGDSVFMISGESFARTVHVTHLHGLRVSSRAVCA